MGEVDRRLADIEARLRYLAQLPPPVSRDDAWWLCNDDLPWLLARVRELEADLEECRREHEGAG